MKNSVLLVESPFQLLCANEAIKHFKLDSSIIYIRYSLIKSNDEQINKLLEILSPVASIKKNFIRVSNKRVSDYYKIIYNYTLFFFKRKSVSKLFVGNLESSFFKSIYSHYDRDRIVLLDDGAKTLTIQKEFSQDYYYDLFTIYRLKSIDKQNIFFNDFGWIKKQIKEKYENDNILFLGSKLNESGIISEEYYLELLKKISNYFVNKSILYIPHRGEEPNKLKKISMMENVTVKELKYPVELYGLYEEAIPKTVVSFYSTALYTMQTMYNLKAISFMFEYDNSKYKDAIDNVYNYYKREMDVVSLKVNE